MTARERIIKMFGGIDKVPAYLIRALGLRKQAEDRRKEELRAHKEKKEQERERVKSLRRPPRPCLARGERHLLGTPRDDGPLEACGILDSRTHERGVDEPRGLSTPGRALRPAIRERPGKSGGVL